MTIHAVRGVESVHEMRGTEAATTCEVRRLVRHGCAIGHNVRESTVGPKMNIEDESRGIHKDLIR